jgi:hypothetical protein
MRASSVRVTATAISPDQPKRDSPHDTAPKKGGREPFLSRQAGSAPKDVVKGLAHPSNRLIAQLNENWRVVYDPLQWILQQRKGKARKKNSGWRGRSFCRTREGLLRCVRDYCGEIDAAALAKLDALPDHYEDWRAVQNLDVRGTDQAPEGSRTDSLLSQGLEAPEIETHRSHPGPSPTSLVMCPSAPSEASS